MPPSGMSIVVAIGEIKAQVVEDVRVLEGDVVNLHLFVQ